jgi:hypothetical protein
MVVAAVEWLTTITNLPWELEMWWLRLTYHTLLPQSESGPVLGRELASLAESHEELGM